MPIGKVWIYRLLFVCVFVQISISPPRIKLAASYFARQFISIQGRESQFFVNFLPKKPKIRRIVQHVGHAHPHVNITIEMHQRKLHARDAPIVKFKHVWNMLCSVWTYIWHVWIYVIPLHWRKFLFGVLFTLIVTVSFVSMIETCHTRAHKFRLIKDYCNLNWCLNSFVCHNVNAWNYLPFHVVESDSVAMFKCKLPSLKLLFS